MTLKCVKCGRFIKEVPGLNGISDGLCHECVPQLLDEYDIEVGGGLGPVAGKVWRIGTMGHTARTSNVEMFLAALDDLL